jgi:hypothetical protein
VAGLMAAKGNLRKAIKNVRSRSCPKNDGK